MVCSLAFGIVWVVWFIDASVGGRPEEPVVLNHELLVPARVLRVQRLSLVLVVLRGVPEVPAAMEVNLKTIESRFLQRVGDMHHNVVGFITKSKMHDGVRGTGSHHLTIKTSYTLLA